jgi:hypothetical protein
MAWQNQLITLYLTVCEHYQNGLWASVQRFSPYSDLSFSDEEVITLYLFGIMGKQRDIKSIYTQAQRYLGDWFPKLPSYTAYVQRLNRLAACFPALFESFCPAQAPMNIAGLVDSFPIVMAQRSRRYRAKVAPEYASWGYCSSKQLHYYGVKLHLIGDHRANTLPLPRYAGLTDAATHDAPAFEQVMHHLPYREIYADMAYEHFSRYPDLPFTLLSPVKKQKGQEFHDAADDWLSRAVSSVRQPIESLFNWIEQKTGIQCASKVRSSNGLLVHVFGRLAAAMCMLNILPLCS